MFPVSTILHPTDFSPPSQHAFTVACSLARDYGSHLIVLHVAELPLSAPGGAMIHPPPGGIREAIREQLHAVKAPDDKVRIEHVLSEGNPAAEILRVAQESQCGLIVMGIHGRTGLARLLMGSVAEQIVRKATCPVLIVKTPVAEKPSS